jgi:hypothetical protein
MLALKIKELYKRKDEKEMPRDEKTLEKRKTNKSSKEDKLKEDTSCKAPTDNNLKSIIAAFNQYLQNEGKSKTTIKSYVGDMEAYFIHFQRKEQIINGVLEKEGILEYKRCLIDRNARAATINTVLNSIRSYNTFAIKVGYMKEMLLDTKMERVTNKELLALRAEE